MISADTYISISDVRDKTSTVMKDINHIGKKIILSQNKPIGVFLSIEEYNNMTKLAFPDDIATVEETKSFKQSSH
jgi:PHD/YefM family antitoxin component YafN of YafNO toxin-antitoxin module